MGRFETKNDTGGVPLEIKGQFDALGKLLKDVRDDQKRIDDEMKKRGSADVLVVEQVGRMDKAFDALKADVDELFKKASRPALFSGGEKTVEAEAKAVAWIKGCLDEHGHGNVDDRKAAEAYQAYVGAVQRWVRKGDALGDLEKKALQVGSAPDGGLWIEPARSDQMIGRLRETSPMRSIATIETISAPSIKFPVDRDDVTINEVSETGTRTETTTPQVGELEIPVHEMEVEQRVTQNMLDDAGFDIIGWLNGKTIDRFARRENYNFVLGNGVKAARGFLTGTPVTTADATRAFGTLQYIATGASSAFATASATVSPADKLLDLIYSFNAGYRQSLTWVGNKTTLGAVRKFKDQDGNFIYDPRLGANGVIDMVLSYRWVEFSDMADFTTANAFAVGLGDFRRGYTIVDRQGIRQLRDPYTARPFTKFVTTKRTGGGVTDSDAIKLLKFGTS